MHLGYVKDFNNQSIEYFENVSLYIPRDNNPSKIKLNHGSNTANHIGPNSQRWTNFSPGLSQGFSPGLWPN